MSSSAISRASGVKLAALLAAGLVLRLAFIGGEGFRNDVQTFEAWAMTLSSHPLSQFYATTKFVDYPPAYFYVLWFIGKVSAVVAPGNYDVLGYLVKVPAILMDAVDGWLLYRIVARLATERWALIAAAAFVLNPAVVFISAVWGQVDSVAAGLVLLAIFLVLRSEDDGPGGISTRIVLAWAALAISLLIKPQSAILLPLFAVFACLPSERRSRRLISTGLGIVAALVLTVLVTLPFHPTANPAAALAWLYGRYEVGKDVYAVNSVNAFNLWAVVHAFWQPDAQRIAGLPQYLWGIALALIATVLILARYAQDRTLESFVQAAALLGLSFFMLATRMHERYIFDGLLLTIAVMPFGRRYAAAASIFTLTLFVNLFYSLTYLHVVLSQTPGVNAADMWPAVTHPLAALNVATFFYLGYVYLGQAAPTAQERPERPFELSAAQLLRPRSWFNPREGLARMAWPLDYVLAGACGAASFVLSYVNYWLPREKVFDEVYFARAAEEYLKHVYIYENTHPPLTKLIITLSTMLFGGLAHGDNAHGWRFLDVTFGAIAVVVLYAFAKRILRSSPFACLAAILFTCDGMHFVQSRIATPEGIVIVFSLGTLYAFYRYWIASESTERAFEPNAPRRVAACAVAALAGGYALGTAATIPFHQSRAAFVVCGLYFAVGLYLLLRLVVAPRVFGAAGRFASYADGTRIVRSGGAFELETPDGGRIGTGKKALTAGAEARVARNGLEIAQGDLRVTYARTGEMRYATSAGAATFSPGSVVDDEGHAQEGRHATAWLVAFTVLLGMLVASKWYGVMAYGVSFVVIAGVWLQRYLRDGRVKLWGNPFGFRLDVSVAAIAFLSMTVYAMVWIPDFIRQIEIKNLTDLMYRQYSMFMYHDTLRATHPYASPWWSWPLDLRPIVYYWHGAAAGGSCCVREIISLPNPLLLWFGLVTVPIVGFLAWRERDKGYALLVLAYLMQWLPWSRSPRITFIYHFYVDIPIVVLCNAIVLQRLWHLGDGRPEMRLAGRVAAAGYVAAVVASFVFFYPVLAASPLPYDAWHARMWIERWII